ncbi:MAG: hypothetical protein WA610_09220 [Thermodesulfovibrionales bacterium]
MKAVLKCSVFVAALLIANAAPAVSPHPAEIEQNLSKKQFTTKQHDTDTTCKVRITHVRGSSNDIPTIEDLLHPLYFDHRMSKKDVLEKVLEISNDNLNEQTISSVSIDCSFHNQKEGGM